MDRVLGVSMTSAAVRVVLVDGSSGEGATVDRDVFDLATFRDAIATGGDAPIASPDSDPPRTIGVTWTTAAEDVAALFLHSLAARGLNNVVSVSTAESAAALTAGIADIAGYTNLAVCVVEPDEAVLATLGSHGVTVDRAADPAEGAGRLLAAADAGGGPLEAVFVLGSVPDLGATVSALEGATTAPVISAADADLALARGAALVSAQAVNTLDAPTPPERRRLPSRTAALTSVLVAAVVTFVVSLSAALGMRLVSGADTDARPREVAKVADQPARAPAPPAVLPAVPPSAAPPPPEAPVQEVAVPEAPPVAPLPVYEPEPPVAPPPAAEYVPPAPVAVPPPAPNYVPAAPPPRLRDRIIDRIPILNRFHEPE